MTKPGEDNRRLATQLRTLRELNSVSGRELARRIGISQSKLSRIECGLALPSQAEVTAWAKAVGAPQETQRLLQTLTDAVRIEAERKLCLRNLAKSLDIAVMQLHHRGQRIHDMGVDLDDLAPVANYLRELAEHGADVAHLADQAINKTPDRHPVPSTHYGGDVQVLLGHVGTLMRAAQTYAAQSYRLLSKHEE